MQPFIFTVVVFQLFDLLLVTELVLPLLHFETREL